MLNVEPELKQLYKTDYLPYREDPVHKELKIEFADLNIVIENGKIVEDSFALEESLCSDTDLKFGACEATVIKITVADVEQDITGKRFTIKQTINGYDMPLGTYTIESAKKQDNKRFKDIVAYDSMRMFDVDVANWYNNLTFPLTLKNFYISLCKCIGVNYIEQALCNENMIVNKTISPVTLNGREVLSAIAEISGGFGHFTRENKLKIISLSGLGLYPSETLYPSEDLFPAESGEVLNAGYRKIDYEEYYVKSINKLQIRQEEGDIGCIVGDGDNPYIIEGNFLVYGKNAMELRTIADSLFLVVKNKYYRPHDTVMVGLPYLEVGDSVSIITETDVIETYIFKRVLNGIQVLKDNISATGAEYRENKVGISTQIEQLRGKTMKIEKNVDGIKILVEDTVENLQSEIKQQANEIELRVKNNEIISSINLSPENIRIDSNKLSITGYVTFYDLEQEGETVINGANIKTGSIKAEKINGENLEVVNGKIDSCSVVNGLYYRLGSTDFPLITVPQQGEIEFGLGAAHTVFPGTVEYNKNVLFNSNVFINNSTPITAGNKGNYTFNPSGHEHSGLSGGSGSVAVTSNAFRPDSSGALNCGAPSYRWDTVYANTGTISTSDARLKKNGRNLDERHLKFIRLLNPVTYQLVDGTSGRYHVGFYAQEVEAAMEECSLSSLEFAGFIKATLESKHIYMLRYEEFIGLIVFAWQQTDSEMQGLKEQVKQLLERGNING